MSRAVMRVFLLLVVGILALPAIAGEGRIPIWRYPTQIFAPGKYIVTRNISSGGGAASVIDILVPDVDIDINGFTLDASGSAVPVINIQDDIVDVAIRNGMLIGGTESIERGPAAATIGQRVVIEEIQSKAATGTAIHLVDIREVVIRRVNILDAGNHGIHLDRTAGLGGFVNGEIDHCSIRFPAGDGIHVDQGSAFAIRHNRIEVPSLNGIHLSGLAAGGSFGCLVGENTISDADGNGVFLESTQGAKVYNNVVSRGETNGILVDANSHDNALLDNLVRQSGMGGAATHPGAGGNGIVIDGDRNHLERNTANDNDACGLLFNGDDNTFGRNMARGNDPPGAHCLPAGCTLLFPPDSCDNGTGNSTSLNNMIPNIF